MVASSVAAELPALLEYRVGDQAEADIVTPVPLVVFDPARTEGLRKAEAQDVNPVFRFLPAAAQQSETDLRSAFTNAQARFTAGLERLFSHPLPLLNAEFGQQHYNEFLKAYRGQNPDFPLTAQLAGATSSVVTGVVTGPHASKPSSRTIISACLGSTS